MVRDACFALFVVGPRARSLRYPKAAAKVGSGLGRLLCSVCRSVRGCDRSVIPRPLRRLGVVRGGFFALFVVGLGRRFLRLPKVVAKDVSGSGRLLCSTCDIIVV